MAPRISIKNLCRDLSSPSQDNFLEDKDDLAEPEITMVLVDELKIMATQVSVASLGGNRTSGDHNLFVKEIIIIHFHTK